MTPYLPPPLPSTSFHFPSKELISSKSQCSSYGSPPGDIDQSHPSLQELLIPPLRCLLPPSLLLLVISTALVTNNIEKNSHFVVRIYTSLPRHVLCFSPHEMRGTVDLIPIFESRAFSTFPRVVV
jgi:hypothetical protein